MAEQRLHSELNHRIMAGPTQYKGPASTRLSPEGPGRAHKADYVRPQSYPQ